MSGRGRGRSGGGRFSGGRGRKESGRGRGRFDGGRSGGRESGRGRSGGRDSGRGRGGKGQELSCPPVALSNILPCSVSTAVKFYVYGINANNKQGNQIDSRSRRGTLFNLGVFSHPNSLLARTLKSHGEGMKLEDYKREWSRVLYFQNSVVFSRDPLPIDMSNGPVVLVGSGDVPSDNGDQMEITDVTCYSPPVELTGQAAGRAAPQAADIVQSIGELSVELRCGGCPGVPCTKTFVDEQAMMRHCAQVGHSPVIMGDKGGTDDIQAATKEIFLQYANVVLKRALGERLMPWGREYVDPQSFTEPTDRDGRSLDVRVFRAFVCEFGFYKPTPNPNTPCSLGLTVDLRAKIQRKKSLLDVVSAGNHQKTYSKQEQDQFKRQFCNEVVIAAYDKKCYSVKDLHFDKSASSLPIPGKNVSHAEYFAQKLPNGLKYPHAVPMVEVLGRNDKSIFLPPEVVCANELDPQLKAKLPMIASFKPEQRVEAIEKIKTYLIPGAQRSKGAKDLLPAMGFTLQDERVKVRVTKLPIPVMTAAGVRIPESAGGNWAPPISKADYKINPKHAVRLNVILVVHKTLKNYKVVYKKIRDMVNGFNSTYRLSDEPFQVVQAGDREQHWGAVEKHFNGKNVPDNAFIIDLSRPPRGQSSDPAYAVVKNYLGKGGYISQFVNFATYNHDQPRDIRKSTTILSGVSRQILAKCGVRLWWVNIPKSVPLPAVFVGVDVFHAPRKYDPKAGKRTAKESVAAVIVNIVREHEAKPNSKVEMYCETEVRAAGQEMNLDTVMNRCVANALSIFNVKPKSCFIWRDGVGDQAIKQTASEEIPAVKQALKAGTVGAGNANTDCPLAYIVCQKRINTKFLTENGEKLPAGACVTDLQGDQYKTFYINGTGPPYSTPKPARFIIAERDDRLNNVSPTALTWALCHDYPNWTGPIKLPAPTQLAHKLAELAGGMVDSGRSIDHQKYAGKVYFL